jgi:hypothetical protein
MPFAGKTDMQILAFLSRGSHPPRLPEPPLNDGAWELILSCWARQASKRPRIEVIMEQMVAMSLPVVSTLASKAQHEMSPRTPLPSSQVSAQTSATPGRPGRTAAGEGLYTVPNGQSREKKHACTVCHKRWVKLLVFRHRT